VTSARSFFSSPASAKGLQPESEDPKPPNPQAPVAGAANHVTEPTPLTPEEYYEYSEHYFNYLVQQLEKAQEEGSDVEAEYSVRFPSPPYQTV
jgi:frataxin